MTMAIPINKNEICKSVACALYMSFLLLTCWTGRLFSVMIASATPFNFWNSFNYNTKHFFATWILQPENSPVILRSSQCWPSRSSWRSQCTEGWSEIRCKYNTLLLCSCSLGWCTSVATLKHLLRLYFAYFPQRRSFSNCSQSDLIQHYYFFGQSETWS